MKTKSLIVVAGILALMGVGHAQEGKPKKVRKAITPEQLEKYDKDKDGKLSKEERAEMKKDKANKPKGGKKKKKDAGN
jgi:hypothetical protein